MNIYAVLAVVSFSLNILATGVLITSNSRSTVNRVFAISTLCSAFQSVVDYGYAVSRSYEEACFWWSLDFIWPLVWMFILHFIMALTETTEYKKCKIFVLIA